MRHYCAVCASSIEGCLDPRLVSYSLSGYTQRDHLFVCSESCERVYDARLIEERNRATIIRDFETISQPQPYDK